MRYPLVCMLVVTVVAVIAGPASSEARSSSCKSAENVGYSLSVAQTNCRTGRAVQRAYFYGDGATVIEARGRTWKCSVKTIARHGYDPVIFSERITGRVLCRHIANKGRFVRWLFDGGGD